MKQNENYPWARTHTTHVKQNKKQLWTTSAYTKSCVIHIISNRTRNYLFKLFSLVCECAVLQTTPHVGHTIVICGFDLFLKLILLINIHVSAQRFAYMFFVSMPNGSAKLDVLHVIWVFEWTMQVQASDQASTKIKKTKQKTDFLSFLLFF